jgi:hypothetical protein
MKSRLYIFLSIWILLTVTSCVSATQTRPVPSSTMVFESDDLSEVFEGTTPCSRSTRPLPQIPEDTDCEQMIWKLVLYSDAATGNPTTYKLDSAYGVPKQGTPDMVGGGTPVIMAGKWDISKGTKTAPNAIVYQLNPDGPRKAVSFQKISDDILHVLNQDGTLTTGHGAWAYTLNRMDAGIPSQAEQDQGSPPEGPTRPPMPPTAAGATVVGVFEGRTPCHDIVLEITKTTPYPGCMKVKWQLTLYQDQNTDVPGTYLSMGTQGFTQGTWAIFQGNEQHSDAIIYRLIPDHSQQPAFFLKADDNNLFLLDEELNFLVGNALFSYTLSRTDKTIP